MSLAGYLFGNVDEQGRLDNDLDEELRESLQHADANVFSQIFNPDTFGINGREDEDDEEEDDNNNKSTKKGKSYSTSSFDLFGDDDNDDDETDPTHVVPKTQHAANAIDFSDINEAIPEELNTTTTTTNINNIYRSYNNNHYSLKSNNNNTNLISKRKRSNNNKIPTNKSTTASSSLLKRYQEEEDDDYDNEDDDDRFVSPPLPHSLQNKSSFTTTTTGSILTPIPTIPSSSSSLTTQFKLPTHPSNTPTVTDIRELFPSFEKDKVLRFSELFMTRIKRRTKLQTHLHVSLDDGFVYEMAADQKHAFLHFPYKKRKLENQQEEDEDDEEVVKQKKLIIQSMNQELEDHHLYHSVMLQPWENAILWGDSDDDNDMYTNGSSYNQVNTMQEEIYNSELDSGDWLESVIWDNDDLPDPNSVKVILDLNDPHMLFDTEYMEDNQQQLLPTKNIVKKGRKPNPRPVQKMPLVYTNDPDSRSKLPQSRFNISNDRHYDMNFAVVRVRQTHGQLVVQHSIPALQLHRSLYKTRMSKSELRSFHRPFFQWPLNTDITFSRVRLKKKIKSKKVNQEEVMRTTKDLTLKDTSNYVLMEYSEEHPPIISNVGMGTLIVNYYRKIDPKDDYIPTEEIGEPFILELEDTSPFMTFGNVESGQTIPVLYNNMIRAPLFKHKVKSTDFLLIKSTHRGQTKYYIRNIPAIYLIGQTYPVQEVPGPQSRKVTTTVKNRLQIVAYRLIKKHPQHRLKMSKLASRFPEYLDIQVRQRLKEFLEFHRRSKDGGGGYWKVRSANKKSSSNNNNNDGLNDGQPPSEEHLRQMCTPEMVCLYESMLVGERHLQDLGYGNIDEDNMDQDENNPSQLETEQQLAPWFATRNFINACQGKAMLKLSGDGDPTGRGEGFSFIRVSMKDIFLRAGESAEEKLAEIRARPKSAHRYNVAEQQQVYKEEIQRIWNAQWEALTKEEEPELSIQEIMDDNEDKDMDPLNSPMTPDTEWRRRYDRAASESMDEDDGISVAGSYNSHANQANKELRITRHIRQENGEIKKEVEIVRDPAVIKAYIAQRQLILENMANLEAIDSGNSSEKNARMKRQTEQQLAKLKKMAERRKQRQLSKTAALAENPVLGLMRGKREGQMRRCGNCGQLGHMKTNKSCPMFYVVNNPNNPSSSTPNNNNNNPTTPSSSSSPLPPSSL